LATTCNNLGLLNASTSETDAARKDYEEAKKIQKELLDNYPGVPAYVQELARTCNNLGALNANSGEIDAARKDYEEAKKIQMLLLDRNPDMPAYQDVMARSLAGLGYLMVTSDLKSANFDPTEGRKLLKEALAIASAMVRNHTGIVEYQQLEATIRNILEQVHE
jgi:tetratricopeptide (TPR) repeat protein